MHNLNPNKSSKLLLTVFSLLLLVFGLGRVKCQLSNDTSGLNDPTVLAFFTQLAYSKVSNLTAGLINTEISENAEFCIKDQDVEWNQTFNFSSDLSFLSKCIQKTGGDIRNRICTAAEINFYFGSSLRSGLGSSNYLKPNRNCNLTSWASGCEPVWACSVSPSGRKVQQLLRKYQIETLIASLVVRVFSALMVLHA